MPYNELSPATLAICSTHYIESGKRNGCRNCPLCAECFKPVPLNYDAMGEHNRKVNAIAEQQSLTATA